MTAYIWRGNGGTDQSPKDGDFGTAANWDPSAIPGDGEGDTGTFNAGDYTVMIQGSTYGLGPTSIGSSVTLDLETMLTLSLANGELYNAGTLHVNAGGDLQLESAYTGQHEAILNTGTISVSCNFQDVVVPIFDIYFSYTTLSGGGQFDLVGGIVTSAPVDYVSLVNVDNTVSGEGTIDANLDNQASGRVFADIGSDQLGEAIGSTTLTLASFDQTSNEGLIEATDDTQGFGGTIDIETTLTNTGTIDAVLDGNVVIGGTIDGQGSGVVASHNAGEVTLKSGAVIENSVLQVTGTAGFGLSGTVTGSSLEASSGGVFTALGGTLDGRAVSVAIRAPVRVSDADSLTLEGLISGSGTITLDGVSATAELIVGPSLDLEDGQIVMADGGSNLIDAASNGDALYNEANTISGNGTIGSTGIVLQNGGTIDATGSSPLYIDGLTGSGAPPSSNSGTLEASGGGDLEWVKGSLSNTGTVAAGSASIVFFERNAVVANLSGGKLTGGTWTVAAGGLLSLTGGAIVTDAAAITLTGAGSVFQSGNGTTATALEQSLTGISTGGSLSVNSRTWTTSNTIKLDGVLSESAGTFTSGRITGSTGSTITGAGTIASSVTDAGTIAAPNGNSIRFTGASNSFSGKFTETGTVGSLVFAGGGHTTIAAGATMANTIGLGVQDSGTTVTIGGTLIYGGALNEAAGTSMSVASQGLLGLVSSRIDGTVELLAGGPVQTQLKVAGALTGAGAVKLDGHASANFGSTVASSEAIALAGTGNVVTLDDPAGFAGKITGFATGDVLDLRSETVTGVSHTATSLIATLSGGGTLTLAVAGSYGSLAIEKDDQTGAGDFLTTVSTSPVTLTADADFIAFAAGSGPNTVHATASTLNSGDHLWGAGNDVLALTGGGTITLGSPPAFTGFTTVTLDNHAYTLSAAEPAAGHTLAIDGTALTSGSALTFDGSGGGGAFAVTAGAGADALTGGAGNDLIDGGAGADQMHGGSGNDTYVVDNSGDKAFEASGQGTDLVDSSVTYALTGQYIENLTLAGTGNIDATGNSLANMITGNSGNNLIDGSTGADQLHGGLGNDTYVIDNSGDKAFELDGQGTDLVRSSVTYSLAGQYIESLTLTGTDNINATGNSLANTILGNGAANTLDGSTGNDTLTGGAGADKFLFDTALSGGNNVDHITDFTHATDKIEMSHAIFTALTTTGPMSQADFTSHIAYNSGTGALSYDLNGAAAGGTTQFATLSTGLTLANTDFAVV